jgi:hypothetical protein
MGGLFYFPIAYASKISLHFDSLMMPLDFISIPASQMGEPLGLNFLSFWVLRGLMGIKA